MAIIAEKSGLENELSILDTIPGLVWTALPNGRIDFVNGEWRKYTGLDKNQSFGKGWQTTVHPEDLPELLEKYQSAFDFGETEEYQARVRKFDGEYRWFLLKMRPVADGFRQIARLSVVGIDINHQVLNEEAVKTSEINLRRILDSIPGMVCTMSPTGEIEHINRQIIEYFKMPIDQLKDWVFSGTVHPDDVPHTVDAFNQAMTTGKPYDVQHRCRRADGVYRWFHVRALPLRNNDDQITGWYLLLIDIDDRKRAEDIIRTSERNLKQIVNTIPALAWSARRDGSADFLNQHFLDYVGLPADEMKNQGWISTVHPDDLYGLKKAWRNILDSGKSGEAEARLRRYDDEYQWFLFRVNPLLNGTGKVIKWYGTNTNIDDRKRAEGRLRRNEEFLTEAQRLSSTGSFWWNIATDEFVWSEEVYRIYGFDPAFPLTVEQIRSRYHPEDIGVLETLREKVHHGENDFEYSHRLLMPEGNIKYLNVVLHPTKQENGELHYIGAVQDVTQQKLSEEALGKIRVELAQMGRAMSLGALTASIAHEVNQPLSGIITNASTCLRMLNAEPPNIEGARETAKRTIRDGNRASDVIVRLRALFSRKDFVSESVDLNEAVREVIALALSDLQRSRVIVKTELDADLPPVVGDRVQLQQVILNLILNASDAMTSIDDRARIMSIKTEKNGESKVGFSVQDAGAGFDQENINKLFEPFYTTKNSGMGIGLAVSRSIIESHHGRIWAALNENVGATFSFSIPRGAILPTESPSEDAQTPPTSHKNSVNKEE